MFYACSHPLELAVVVMHVGLVHMRHVAQFPHVGSRSDNGHMGNQHEAPSAGLDSLAAEGGSGLSPPCMPLRVVLRLPNTVYSVSDVI